MVPFCSSMAQKLIQRIFHATAMLAVLSIASAEVAIEVLSPWFSAQEAVQTWTADLSQTRRMKSLVQPLVSTGRVWFATPNRFRWELGNPAQTIALRGTNALFVVYPRLQRVERFQLTETGPWRDTLELLEAGFPRSAHQVREKFTLLSLSPTGTGWKLQMQPRSAAARKVVPLFTLGLSTNPWSLAWTEMTFPDGSTLRNDFWNARTNVAMDPTLFTPAFEASYKVVEPLGTRR